jgi:hypothetical protein
MKQSGTTIVFVIVCIGVLLVAFAIGLCIREIRFSGAENKTAAAAKPEKSASELKDRREQARQMPGIEGMDRGRNLSPEERLALVEERAGMRERFENMTDEEKEAFRSQVRERFAGRRRDMGPQLSEEDRAKMREEIDALRARWDQMSEAEREEARNQISEKYGFTPRGLGSDRGFGDRGGEGRPPAIRPDEEQTRSDDEQTEPNEE